MIPILAAQAMAADLVLRDANVWDAGGPRHADAIVIRGDRIASVGAFPPDAADLEAIDLHGATVIPGLVDAHVHLSLTPGGAFLGLDRAAEEDLWRMHLRAYVASGVTTVLDTGILPADATRMRELAAEGPAPDIQYLGPLVSPPDGYVNVVLPQFPAAVSPAALRAQLDAFAPLEPIGVKITVEEGMVTKIWPLYDEPIWDALVRESATRKLPLYAHAMSNREYRIALDHGVAGFVHPPQAPSRALLRELGERGLPVVSTLSAFESLASGIHPERVDDPLVALTVPEVERTAAKDPILKDRSAHTVADAILAGTPGFVRNRAAAMFQKDPLITHRVAKMQRAIVALRDAGVPIVMGSDSGNWPVFLFEFHGPTSIREVELLVEGGLTPSEALTAATAAGAAMLRLSDEIGTIAPGARADLVVLDRDPLADIGALRSPRYVVRAGELRTPAAWMAVTAAGTPATPD